MLKLTTRELKSVQRFSRFVVLVYLQSCYTSPSAVDAPVNDMLLIERLNAFDDKAIKTMGLAVVERRSWYMRAELASLALFSNMATIDDQRQLVSKMTTERGSHLLTSLPTSISDLQISKSLFSVMQLDDSFLCLPVESWREIQSYLTASIVAHRLACVNDCAERGVSLITDSNETTIDEAQKQYLL